jgi:hypothetical protein
MTARVSIWPVRGAPSVRSSPPRSGRLIVNDLKKDFETGTGSGTSRHAPPKPTGTPKSWFIVFGEHPEIERVVVIDNANFGVECGRLTFARVVLEKMAGDRRVIPRCFVGQAVERNRSGPRTAIRRRSSLAVA